MLVCEAAGYDVVIVETVGVGQSETTVASMVDFFLVLHIAGAGDELQGIKKGVLEVADAIVINKADGENLTRAQAARREYEAALHMLMPHSSHWTVPVLTCSANLGSGISEVWSTIREHKERLGKTGEIAAKRTTQALDWLDFLVDEGLRHWFHHHPQVAALLPQLRHDVERDRTSPTAAAEVLLAVLGRFKQ
jgi:LAO/AO transport system kinase